MTPLDSIELFAGVGGFALGLERAGLCRPVMFCEINPYSQAVLRKHWPEVPIHDDIKTLSARQLVAAGIFPRVAAGGFPCTDISGAGLGAGIHGECSGLYFEIIRLARELAEAGHPLELILLENVSDLLSRGMGDVLGALASIGFDACWDCIPASHVGAPHDRDRVWIVAHAIGSEWRQESYDWALGRMGRLQQSVPWDRDWQSALREFRGMDDGSAYRVDRVDTLRNGLVPQIAEAIGRAVLAAKAEERLAA